MKTRCDIGSFCYEVIGGGSQVKQKGNKEGAL